MARYKGVVGYATSVETPSDSGIWVDSIVEKTLVGTVVRDARNVVEGEDLNPDVTPGVSLSVVGSDENLADIRYAVWGGVYWTVVSTEFERPRLTLRLGGVYNGPKPPPSP